MERPLLGVLLRRIRERPRFIQILMGPRQVGKSTLARQIADQISGTHYAAADLPVAPGPEWIESQWTAARQERKKVLILDEVQKVHRWSEVVKALWDEEVRRPRPMRVLILGSSSLLVQRGLTESLAGRFEQIFCPHWSYDECRTAFGWDLETFLFYGGYPGGATLIRDPGRWRDYVLHSLIETVVARDVLQMHPVAKPALLRQLFGLCCQMPARILSYTKMIGQLQDAGNTTTLAHYLTLLDAAFILTPVLKWSGAAVRRRSSSPKLIVRNNALISSMNAWDIKSVRRDPAAWGWIVENAVGAHLLNEPGPPPWSVHYWRDGNDEVDYVVSTGKRLFAIEVKTGRSKASGLGAFKARYPKSSPLVIGPAGIPLETFFLTTPKDLLR